MKPKKRHLVIMSFLYWALRRLFELIVLSFQSEDAKEVEIVVLRHQLQVLRRQVARPDLALHDRAFLAAASRVLPKMRWGSFFVCPETILAWHRRLVHAVGPTRGAAADRPRRPRSVASSSASPMRTRPGAIVASRGSSSTSGFRSRRAPCGRSCGGRGSIPRRGGRV
jgi:hypothetical protein